MLGNVRRVVTGHDAAGKAIFIQDGITPVVFGSPQRPGYAVSEVWVTDSMPAAINQPGEPTQRKRAIEPPPHGTVFRVADFPPESTWIHKFDRAMALAAFAALGSKHAHTEMDTPPHPMMHRTETVDYALVLEGEIYLVLDDTETKLQTGDVVVQRGTNHAWSNRSDRNCRMAFILIDGERGAG
ncbi:cupin domain-containing protein [Ferrovibrio sp.]|uniref:cupin domain-containing protein n=1 Tax=Ferrovibrio sp. TaxID=1917215 RepID=UPI0035B1E482